MNQVGLTAGESKNEALKWMVPCRAMLGMIRQLRGTRRPART